MHVANMFGVKLTTAPLKFATETQKTPLHVPVYKQHQPTQTGQGKDRVAFGIMVARSYTRRDAVQQKLLLGQYYQQYA